MDKGRLQESIVTLYLRLNGYFTSGLILHHPEPGKNRTELDVLAVRFPWHTQPDRTVETDPELKCPKTMIDIIVGEVKSAGEKLRFNQALAESSDAVCKTLQWVGAFDPEELVGLPSRVQAVLKKNALHSGPQTVEGPRNTCIRGILLSPERNAIHKNQQWFLPGSTVLGYLWRCLNPAEVRPSCSTQYDFGLWGADLEPLVRYVKQTAKPPATFKSLFEDFSKRRAGE